MPKQVIMIDNYDSFTFNLVQYFQECKAEVTVFRNDIVTTAEIIAKQPDLIVISPGPSDPDHAGISLAMVADAQKSGIPLFGVCLGLQAIGQAFGGKIVRTTEPKHGKTSPVTHTGVGAFKSLASPLTATRYHSLVIERATLPDELEITAETEDGTIMAVRHRTSPIEGVQFHPESVLTTDGRQMIANVLANL